MNKIGFDISDNDAEEPETGYAETGEDEEYDWFDFIFPKMLDFFMVYGALSLIRDVIDFWIKRI